MNNIHNKYSTEYNTKIQRLSSILNKDEKGDSKKPSKKLEGYLTQRTKLSQEQTEQVQEITNLKSQQKKLLNIASYVRGAEKESKRLSDHSATQEQQMNNFLGTRIGGTK